MPYTPSSSAPKNDKKACGARSHFRPSLHELLPLRTRTFSRNFAYDKKARSARSRFRPSLHELYPLRTRAFYAVSYKVKKTCLSASVQAAGPFFSISVVIQHIAAAAGDKVDIFIPVGVVDQRAQSVRHTQIRLIRQHSFNPQLIREHFSKAK